MIVVPEGNANGRFDVYSANNGVNKTYPVDLRAVTCECGDYEHRKPAGGYKHIRRVKLALELMPVPVGVEDDLDEALIHDRAKYGVLPAHTPDSGGESAPTQAVATDGGVAVVESEPVANRFTDGVAIDHRNVPVEVTVPRFFGLEPDVFIAVCDEMNRDIAAAAARDTKAGR